MIKLNQQTFVSFQYILKPLGMESKRDIPVSDLQCIVTLQDMKIIYTALQLQIHITKTMKSTLFPPAPIPWVM